MKVVLMPSGVSMPWKESRASPSLVDFDGDFDIDIILGHTDGTLSFFELSGCC